MQCTVISRSGQVLARGKLILHQEEPAKMRLNLKTNAGRLIEGGIVDESGDLTSASEVLFEQCYQTWGMTGLTLTVTIR
jgi:predicted amino acid dehydrogenase